MEKFLTGFMSIVNSTELGRYIAVLMVIGLIIGVLFLCFVLFIEKGLK